MNRSKLLFAPTFLILAILACNVPTTQGTGGDSAATITALAATIQAQNATATPAGAPTETPTQTVSPAPAGNTPGTATLTATSSVPMVTVSVSTNCRSGPGTVYDQIGALAVGQTAQVVGKYTPANYWIINNPSGSGTCWLWGQYATVSGNTSGLPEMVPPPTPTPGFTKTPTTSPTPKVSPTPTVTATPTQTSLAPPAAPSSLSYTKDCQGGYRGVTPIWIETIKLAWQDNANNETGYYVYKDGSQQPALPPNATQYTIELRYDQGTGGALYVNFGVKAFNSAGSSMMTEIDATTCP